MGLTVPFVLYSQDMLHVFAHPAIVDMPITWTEHRDVLTREYAMLHYGLDQSTIIPQAVVVHWTAGDTWQSAYYHFDHEEAADGTVQVSAQFLVDRDGTIYRLAPECNMCRHIIGYNWCSIGIENVGGVGGVEDLTDAQLSSNIELIRYLHEKYPSISYVFGHYQQDIARETGLYRENVAGYRSVKSDPGPKFMEALKENLGAELNFCS